jgi:hypothetical protein
VTRRCYHCETAEARYEAYLDYEFTPIVLLCEECAQLERAWGAVIWIRTITASPR